MTGTETGTSYDSQENAHTIKFSRPTSVAINVAVTITYDAKYYPLDGDDQIKTAIADAGNARPTGADAVSSAIVAACFSVPGVIDVVHAYLAINPATPTTTTTIPISLRELATWTTTNITVSSSSATP